MQSEHVVGEVVLYHFWPSLCSQKVRLALAEKGIAYRSVLVNIGPPMENYAPEYARLNPCMVVPTLTIGDDVVTDSARIVAEIDRRFDGPALRADDPTVQQLISLQDGLQIREIAYARKTGVLGFLVKGAFERRIRILTEQRDANPDLARLYDARLADVREWKSVSDSEEAIAARRRQVVEALSTVEEALTGPWLAGERYSLADVVWTVIVARLHFMGFHQHLGPRVEAWYGRAKERPSFEAAQVWESVRPLVMAPIVAQVLMTRLGLR